MCNSWAVKCLKTTRLWFYVFVELYTQTRLQRSSREPDQYLILGADSDTDIRELYILISIYPLTSTCFGDDVSQWQGILLFIKKTSSS